MQRGHLFKASGAWYLRYYCNRRRLTRRLGRVSDYPTAKSIEPLRHRLLAEIEAYPANSLGRFVEEVYLPHVQRFKGDATHKRYHTLWQHIRPAMGGWPQNQARPLEIAGLLNGLAFDRGLNRATLRQIRMFLAGVFRHACQPEKVDPNEALLRKIFGYK